MKDRPRGFLMPETMPAEVFSYVVELHDYLWRIMRAVEPGVSGVLSDHLDRIVNTLESPRPSGGGGR